jgi:hypothetical protein
MHAKTSSRGRKTVPGPFCGSSREEESEENSRSENETRLVTAGPPGREPYGLTRQCGLPGVVSAAEQALRQLMATTSSRDPTQMVKERRIEENFCIGVFTPIGMELGIFL